MFARKPELAKEFAHKTANIKGLPEKKGKSSKKHQAAAKRRLKKFGSD